MEVRSSPCILLWAASILKKLLNMNFFLFAEKDENEDSLLYMARVES